MLSALLTGEVLEATGEGLFQGARRRDRRDLPGGAEEESEGLLQSSTPLDRQETVIDSNREAEVVWRK